MATNFNVQLKKTDGAKSGSHSNTYRPPGVRREFHSKPMSDIKAMFEKGSDGAGAKPPEPGISYAKKPANSSNQTPSAATNKTSAIKTKSNATLSNQKRETVQKSDALTAGDMAAFDMLKQEIETKGAENLDKDLLPSVAVAKVYDGGQTFKATMESKTVSKTLSGGGNTEVSKSAAASMLSFGLTKLRTRPSSLKNEDNIQNSEAQNEDPSANKSDKSETSAVNEKLRSSSPSSIKPRDKYIPGAPKGWKGTVNEPNGRSSPKLEETKLTGKLQSDIISPRNGQRSLIRTISPVTRTSSSDSSAGNLSPRGYKPAYIQEQKGVDSSSSTLNNQSGVGKVTGKYDAKLKLTSNVIEKSKVSKDNKNEDLERIRSRLKPTTDTKLETIKDKSLTNTPNLAGQDVRWNNKDRCKVERTHKPLHRISSSSGTESSSSVSKSESLGSTPRTGREGSPIQRNASPITGKVNSPDRHAQRKAEYVNVGLKAENTDLRRKKFTVSRKMSAEKFQDLKKGFEKSDQNKEQTVEIRKKLDIIPAKAILEKRESFENPDVFTKKPVKTEICSPISKKKLLERKDSFEHPELRRKNSGPVEIVTLAEKGKVLQTIKSLNELDEAAQGRPQLKRRSRSLPSSGIEDDIDSSGYYEDVEHEHGPYYHDIHGVKLADDASNEGDISSEADQIYEEIDALRRAGKETSKFNNRRATAFIKRKKKNLPEELPNDIQAGVDADVDSDSDSSGSGIYEAVSGDHFQIGESDSPDVEAPAPSGQKQQKKKKKKDGKGSKNIYAKFKQFYRGKESKSLDNTEGALKSIAGPGLVLAPQSVGVFDKLKKNLRKTKSSDSSLVSWEAAGLSREDIPVCDSDGTDTDIDLEMDQSSKSQSLERSDEGSSAAPPVPPPPNPPPLPPRSSVAMQRASNTGDQLRLSNASLDSADGSGNNYKRMSNTADVRNGGSSPNVEPPLPPRNRVSQNLDLNLVIPIAPGGADMRKSGWPPVKDSYLHGQKINTTTSPTDLPYMDESPVRGSEGSSPLSMRDKRLSRGSRGSSRSSSSVQDDDEKPPPLPTRPAPKQPLQGKDSYVCVDPPDDLKLDTNYSLADEIRKELEKRPVSSGYIQAHDLSTVPEPRSIIPPFEDVLKFKSQYEEDGLYIDLSDDQVYGTLGTRYKSKLESESLYQFYNKDKVSRASKRKAIYAAFDESDEEEYDSAGEKVYEDLSDFSSGSTPSEVEGTTEEKSQSRISTLEMFGKKGTVLRALWAEMPEVKDSGVLDNITAHERKMQESMFEIITSEATYLKSLNVLINVFLLSKEFGSDLSDRGVLTRQERHVVFSNIGTIRDASERFLSDLESRWQESVVISDVCDIIRKHALRNFECYVHYCSNQTFQDRAVTALKKKLDFSEALKRLESDSECQGLPMISFLLLPMQRITRLPLLVDAICHRMDPISDKNRHTSAIKALDALNKVVKRCNDGAKKMQQTEQMCLIAKQLDFRNKDMTQIPLISSSRYLVKQGELTRIISDSGSRLPFGKAKAGKQATYVFLFNDILLITKKKSNQYVVTDYSMRNAIHVELLENQEKIAKHLPLGVPGGCKNLFLLVMLENYDKKMVECVFSCNSLSDRARWMEAVTPVKVSDDHERIYEEWDCPQVQCVTKYVPKEPDELALEESDVVNVFKKLEDGWYEGERMRDSERGWFPKENVEEIVNSHVRARNLRMKYRLMQVSEQNER